MRSFVAIAGDGLTAVPPVPDPQSDKDHRSNLLIAEKVAMWPHDYATERGATKEELAHIRWELRGAIFRRAIGLLSR